ncbi:MAG TPA: class I SAM-dependent methyltransferase [Actinomycetota bacterium]|nr:class I SAM-dependent methyltransferase [Actinomycetota bacterium]
MSDFDPKAFWENRLKRDFNLQGVGYRSLGLGYNQWLYRVRARVFRRMARRIRAELPNGRVLDIGSGTGFYIREWIRLGARSVVGSDITDVACDGLRDRFPDVRIERLDIGAPLESFSPGEFDILSAFDVLFHILDDERYKRALDNIASLLRPGGYFFYSDNFLRAGEHRAPHQVSRFRPQIEQALGASGFRIVERRPMFVLMNAPLDTQSALLKWFWARIEEHVQKSEKNSKRTGAVLYPTELLLTKLLHEGPSTEVVLCKKGSSGSA